MTDSQENKICPPRKPPVYQADKAVCSSDDNTIIWYCQTDLMMEPEDINWNFMMENRAQLHISVYRVGEQLAKFAANADILPLYEKSTMEYIFRNHYSFKTNEYLQCAWTKFKDNISSRVVAPIELPGQGDLHFHNQAVKLKPSESIHKKSNFRKSLKPGPGVDYGGQMPIPQDLISKRNAPKKDKDHKRTSKNKKQLK